jgi:hypothetical protein
MLVHPEKKLIYLATPRTASTATRKALLDRGFIVAGPGNQHDMLEFPDKVGAFSGIRGPLLDGVREDWTTFTTVRNPFDAAVSWVYMRGDRVYEDGLFETPWNTDVFVNTIVSPLLTPHSLLNLHTDVDIWLRYETLQDDLDVFLEGSDLSPTPIPYFNVSAKRRKKHYQEHYTPESRQYIQNRYAMDFEKFNYSWED